MKIIGQFSFPTKPNESWAPVIRYRALHSKVLVVARTRTEGAWKAYCGPVAGLNHSLEAKDDSVGPLYDGADVGEKLARFLFPEFDNVPYAR